MAASDYSWLRVVHFDDTFAAMADAVLPEFVVRDEVLIELYPFIPSHISDAHGDAKRRTIREPSSLAANGQRTGNLPNGKGDTGSV